MKCALIFTVCLMLCGCATQRAPCAHQWRKLRCGFCVGGVVPADPNTGAAAERCDECGGTSIATVCSRCLVNKRP